MLVDFWDRRKKIAQVPYAAEFDRWKKRLTQAEIAAIQAAIDAKISGDRIHTSSWMPGDDWTGTPYEPIYRKACRCDQKAAAQCFGLFVWEAFMKHPDVWTSEHFEKNGEPIRGRTYFKIKLSKVA
jgi:hypothetical protein